LERATILSTRRTIFVRRSRSLHQWSGNGEICRSRSRQEFDPKIRTAGGNRPVTSGVRAGPGMRRISRAGRPGTSDDHNPR
jgi:hypothetical protein